MWRGTWLLSDSMRIDSCKSWPYYLAWEIADRYLLAFSFSWFSPCRSLLQWGWGLYCRGPNHEFVRTSCLIGNRKWPLPFPRQKRCFFKCQLRKRFLRASWLRQATTKATSTRTAKINRLRLAKQPLCMCITLCTFLRRHRTFTTWNFLISRFVEDVNTRQRISFFSFSELRYSLLELNSRENCQNMTSWTRCNRREKFWSSATDFTF